MVFFLKVKKAPTLKKVVEVILKDVIKDKVMKQRVMELRDVLLGRVRTRLSASPEEMKSSLYLYIETHCDTEALLKLLLQILDSIGYNYSNILVEIRN